MNADTLIADADADLDAREAAIRHELEGQSNDDRVRVKLRPTQWAFVHSDADVVLLESSRREGKTTSAIVRLLRIASQYRAANPVRVACVRDSWTNLQRTVMESIRKGARQGWWSAQFIEADTECILDRGAVHLYFFGMEHLPDANKFQSFEVAILWIEEPAAAADFASGVPVEVFALGVTSLSQQGVPTSVQITTNPPDETHWTVRLINELEALDRPDLRVERFWIPPGENATNQPQGYRDRMRVILDKAGRPDLVQRLVEGQRGSVTLGLSVTPNFAETLHVAPEPLITNPAWASFLSFDFGSSPACTIAQTTPRGHLNILGALETPEGEALGVEEFVTQLLLPWFARYKMRLTPTAPRAPGSSRSRPYYRFRIIGDPAGVSREASSSERSAAHTLEQMFKASFEPAPVEWAARRDSGHWVLGQNIGARRLAQLDPDETKPLVKGLRGDFHYHRTPSGVVSDRPVKNHASHVSESFLYLCAVLYPVAETLQKIARGTDVAPPPRSAAAVPWWGR